MMRYRAAGLVLLVVVLSPILAIYAHQDGSVDAQEARAIALALYPNASVVLVESVFENGVQTWDVKLNNGLAVYVHATTGAVIEIEPWNLNDRQGVPTNLANVPTPVANPVPVDIGTDGVDFLEAQRIALALYPNASVVLVESVFENGVQAWDVKLNNGLAVYVHATTGAVIEIEPWNLNNRQDTSTNLANLPTPVANPIPVDIGTDGVDFLEAQRIALSYYPNASVVLVESVFENGVQAWDVKLNNGVAVYVHAQTGVVIEFEWWHQGWSGNDSPYTTLPQATISLQQALAIVRNIYPNATVAEAELTYYNYYHIPAWDIELRDGTAIYIHAITGEILEIEDETTSEITGEITDETLEIELED